MNAMPPPPQRDYIIKAAPPPERFARGWHVLGLSSTFRDGRPHELEAFGTKLTIFAGEDGKINIIDGYCPHMGASLGQGMIVGNAVSCPFHGWEWNGQGQCSRIPFSKHIPRLAKIKSWPSVEVSGQLFVYNDPEGNPVPENVNIPAIGPYDQGECTPWNWEATLINTNCRELVDNNSDNTHFYYVHGWIPRKFKNVFEGHLSTQIGVYESRNDRALGAGEDTVNEDGFRMESTATYYGPAYMINYQKAKFKDQLFDCWLINSHYPITPESFMLNCGVTVRKPEGMSMDDALGAANGYAKAFRDAFYQDVHIWQHKRRIDNPILSQFDGPIYQLRKWYEQFYVDVADVTPEMTDRFELEVDMTDAVAFWDKEQGNV